MSETCCPIKTLSTPVETPLPANLPNAVVPPPVVKDDKQSTPIAVFDPSVAFLAQSCPKAQL